LYLYDTHPKDHVTWLSLVSWPTISNLDAYSQSFKHFKEGFFRVVLKSVGHALFLDDSGNTKVPFYWTDNPWQFKDMQKDELSTEDRNA